MLRFLKGFFGKPKHPDTLAPYKVEAPAEVEVAPALAPIVQEKPVKKAPAKKAPVAKPAVAAKTPRARKTPAK
jgi:hypothetical protein